MKKYKVAEIFTSINGEGTRAGQLALFIRMQGCNLNCSFCDTKWANEADTPYTWMTTEEILNAASGSGIRNITLTGGEPLRQPGIRELISALTEEGKYRVEIETNGSISLAGFENAGEARDSVFLTMDYKLPGSNMEGKMNPENFRFLQPQDTVKFVVSDRMDLDRARNVIQENGLTGRCHVYLSPVFGRIHPEKIVEYMKEYRMNEVNLQLQMHKIIWDPYRRGV